MKNENLIKCCLDKGICPDNFIGTIENMKPKLNFSISTRKEFTKRNSIDDIINNGYKNIVMILESPHINEYKYANENFIAPAIGKTGDFLQRYFYACIKSCLSHDEKYNVILMNAIQYQCSLGEDTIIYRDKLWCDLWFNYNKKDDFINRLKHYNPDIIINACTIGMHIVHETNKKQKPNLKYIKDIIQKSSQYETTIENIKTFNMNDKYSLRGYVETEIINFDFEKDVKLYYIAHPSSWFNSNNRETNDIITD